jgi:hypothetical protein
MQLIPFVLSVFFILSLLAMSSYTKIRQHIFFQERVLQHLAIEAQLEDKAIDIFLSQATKTQEKKEKKAKKKDKVFENHRKKGYLLNSRLILKPLFTREDLVLKKVASRFLNLLYPKSLGFDSDALLEEILQKGGLILKSKPKTACFTLYDLFEPSKNLIRALEGKPGYCFGQENSYPPLADYLEIFPKSDHSPVCSKFASIPLLIALFEEERAAKILKEESKRFFEEKSSAYCNKKDLQELFIKETPIDPKIWDLVGDQMTRKPKQDKVEMIVLDPKLRLEARGMLRTFPLKRGDLPEEVPSQTPSTPGI